MSLDLLPEYKTKEGETIFMNHTQSILNEKKANNLIIFLENNEELIRVNGETDFLMYKTRNKEGACVVVDGTTTDADGLIHVSYTNGINEDIKKEIAKYF